MKYSEDTFIYPYSEEEEKEIEMIKNFYKIGTPIEDIAKASNLIIDKVNEIIDSDN